jgi:hypothetical protein
MAFSPFTAGLFTAGQILTAAQMNTYIRDNIMAGGPVYATEAARNADIPSPFEGQRAYITGSTVAAATGGTTAVPTGIQTIYNGAAWVCVTPVGASTTTSGTTTAITYSDLTGGGTAPTVTLSTGTTALLFLSVEITSSVAGVVCIASVAVSGAGVVAANDNVAILSANAQRTSVATTVVMTGLTAGTNTFAIKYAQGGGATGTMQQRRLVVQGIA